MSALYSSLNVETYEVRMLAFPPASHSPAVECAMRTVSLINPPRYVALSYCWGDPNATTNIQVDGVNVAVTLNLKAALQQLRRKLGNDTMLWADALCINQMDTQEKSQQVRLMTQIYAKAESCYAWLGGHEYEDARAGISSIKLLDTLAASADKTLMRMAIQAACAGFLSLCRCPYWQRRWVIQELTAAQDVQVICMDEMVSFEVIRSAYNRCSASEFWLSEHCLVTASFAQILHIRLGYHENQELTLIPTIAETQQFLSMDLRDKIFALIGICKDGPTLVPAPSYSQSVEDVSRDLTRALLRRNANFDLIFIGQKARPTPLGSVSLPTWAMDWCSSSLSREVGTAANAENFWPRSLAASALHADPNTLRMEGVTLGTIVALSSPLSWDVSTHITAASPSQISLPFQRSSRFYYTSRRMTLYALQKLILDDEGTKLRSLYKQVSPHFTRSKRHGYILAASEDPETVFSAWLRNNDQFMNDKSSLQSYFTLHQLFVARIGMKFWVLLIVIVSAWSGLLYIAYKYLPNMEPALKVVSGFAILCCLAMVSLSIFPPMMEPLLESVRMWAMLQSPDTLSRSIEQSRRVYILNTGMLGTTSSSAQTGDKICLLAGCTNAAVLRSHTIQNTVSYSVVGATDIQLNESDRKKYKDLRPVWSRGGRKERWRWYEHKTRLPQPLEEYKVLDWWERFTLI